MTWLIESTCISSGRYSPSAPRERVDVPVQRMVVGDPVDILAGLGDEVVGGSEDPLQVVVVPSHDQERCLDSGDAGIGDVAIDPAFHLVDLRHLHVFYVPHLGLFVDEGRVVGLECQIFVGGRLAAHTAGGSVVLGGELEDHLPCVADADEADPVAVDKVEGLDELDDGDLVFVLERRPVEHLPALAHVADEGPAVVVAEFDLGPVPHPGAGVAGIDQRIQDVAAGVQRLSQPPHRFSAVPRPEEDHREGTVAVGRANGDRCVETVPDLHVHERDLPPGHCLCDLYSVCVDAHLDLLTSTSSRWDTDGVEQRSDLDRSSALLVRSDGGVDDRQRPDGGVGVDLDDRFAAGRPTELFELLAEHVGPREGYGRPLLLAVGLADQ